MTGGGSDVFYISIVSVAKFNVVQDDVGGSPALVARGFNTVQAFGAGEQIQIQVPNEKVGLIIGKHGDTIKNLQTRSGARIQLIPQHLPEGDQSKERTVRVTGDKKQIEFARELIKEVMDQMNGEGSYMAPEVVVVGRQFTAPNQVDLTIVRHMMTISGDKFGVTDAEGNIMFKVKVKLMSLLPRRVLLDADGNPIVSFQKEFLNMSLLGSERKMRETLNEFLINCMHSTWKVYRGDSNDSKDLLFTVRKSSLFQIKTELDVFLASNTSKDERDFNVKGSWFEQSCTIYAGNSSTVIAQMHRTHSFSSIVLGQDKFAVTVYPHVDYAFIVALVVILEEINEEGKHNGGTRRNQ